MMSKKETYKKVHYKDIYFTKDSPRLPKSVKEIAKKHIKNEDVFDALLPYYLFNEDIEDVIGSMSLLGWFPTEPANVYDVGNGKYKIVDGQRRLIAMWLMHNPDNPLCPEPIKKYINEELDQDKINEFNYVYIITIWKGNIRGWL